MIQKKNKKVVWWAIAVLYLAVLLKITVFRADFLKYELFSNGTIQYIPLLNFLNILRDGRYLYFIYLFAGNIVWFIPFGFGLAVMTGQSGSALKIMLFGLLLSLIIEFLQFMFGTGISETDDLILNTFGALLGYLLYRLYMRIKRAANDSEMGGHNAAQRRD